MYVATASLPPPPPVDIPIPLHPADKNDVMLNPLVFHQMRKALKFKPSVDLFASAEHHQLPRYYSKTADPHSVGVDAMQANWAAEHTPYANPPWPMIPAVLRKVIRDQVRIILVIPEWPAAPWYHLYRQVAEKSELLTDPVYLSADGAP